MLGLVVGGWWMVGKWCELNINTKLSKVQLGNNFVNFTDFLSKNDDEFAMVLL